MLEENENGGFCLFKTTLTCSKLGCHAYLHEHRLAEFFSVDNLDGNFLPSDTMNTEFDQSLK